MEFLTRLFPQVRRLQRDAIRIRSEREEWRQRYTSLHARVQQSDPMSTPTPPSGSEWRERVALWAAEQARILPGDFVECGLRGSCVTAEIIKSLEEAGITKTLYLLAGSEADDFETVGAFPSVQMIRGAIAAALPRVPSPQIALLSIATNSTAPAEHFWPRLVPGAILLLNDYARSARDPLNPTWDAFAAFHEAPILPLPTGQGIMIKR